MKKILAIILMVISLSFTSAFASEFIYNGYAKTDFLSFAVINDEVYETDQMISETEYKLVVIEKDYIILENQNDGTPMKINFFKGKE